MSLLDPFPAKPKGMHWRTYDRLEGLSAAAERRVTFGMMRALERVDRKLSRRR